MGVHGLWQLLQPSGRPVSLESLDGKVLAVDVSIWLHQTLKGMRDKDGNPVPNAHLQGLFTRVCKLLYYKIKPVFVFDGGVPVLKRQTLAARKERKTEAERESSDIAQKLLRNLMRSQVVKGALGDGGNTSGRVPGVRRGKNNRDEDMFELTPLPEAEEIGLNLNAEEWEREFEQQENWIKEGLAALSDVHPDSDEFKTLPMEIQHEVLSELKERRKYHSLSRLTKMPEESDDFSSYQLKKLMKQSTLTNRIEAIKKDMGKKTTADLAYSMGDDYYGDDVEARRIVSEDTSHYILMKGLTKKKQEEEAERFVVESMVKKEESDDEDEYATALGKSKPPLSKDAGTKKTGVSKKEGEADVAGSDSDSDREILASVLRKGRQGRKRRRSSAMDVMGVDGSRSSSKPQTGGEMKITATERENEEGEWDSGSRSDVGIMDSTSSSEDEGFIEINVDPSAPVVEDELFPAGIFDVVATEGSHVAEKAELTKSFPSSVEARVGEPAKSEKTRRLGHRKQKDGMVVSKGEIVSDRGDPKKKSAGDGDKESLNKDESKTSAQAENAGEGHKRKNVMSDILKELQQKKQKLLESLEGEEENLTGMDEETGEGEGLGEGTEKDAYSAASEMKKKSVIESDSQSLSESGDFEMKTVKGKYISSDSEDDEQLKLAIELSLQSAHSSENVPSSLTAVDDSTKQPEVRRRKRSSPAKPSKVTDSKKTAVICSGSATKSGNNSDDGGNDVEMDEATSLLSRGDDTSKPSSPPPRRESFHLSQELKILEEEKEAKKEDDNRREGEEVKGKEEDDEMEEVLEDVDERQKGGRKEQHDQSKEKVVSGVSEDRLQPEDFEEDPTDLYYASLNEGELLGLNSELASERTALLLERGRQNRLAMSVTDQVNLEAQELLRLFGIPYVVGPMEAEAQCAYLDITGQTDGTITDDSDIWLFGGRRMYKNFFNQNKHVEFYSFDRISNHFGIGRDQLINIALLCGSDYTEGIQGVGPVRALEIMAEFPGTGSEGLRAFRTWWEKMKKREQVVGSKTRARLKNLKLPNGFPSETVVRAYLSPTVDESTESFAWKMPELDVLRDFAKLRFGWSREKSDQSLVPMMKQLTQRKNQGRIHAYFQPESFVQSAKIRSDRLKKALSLVKNSQGGDEEREEEEDEMSGDIETKRMRKAQGGKGRVVGESGKGSEKRKKQGGKGRHEEEEEEEDEQDDPEVDEDVSDQVQNVAKKGKKRRIVGKNSEDAEKPAVSENENGIPKENSGATVVKSKGRKILKGAKNVDEKSAGHENSNRDSFMTDMAAKVQNAKKKVEEREKGLVMCQKLKEWESDMSSTHNMDVGSSVQSEDAATSEVGKSVGDEIVSGPKAKKKSVRGKRETGSAESRPAMGLFQRGKTGVMSLEAKPKSTKAKVRRTRVAVKKKAVNLSESDSSCSSSGDEEERGSRKDTGVLESGGRGTEPKTVGINKKVVSSDSKQVHNGDGEDKQQQRENVQTSHVPSSQQVSGKAKERKNTTATSQSLRPERNVLEKEYKQAADASNSVKVSSVLMKKKRTPKSVQSSSVVGEDLTSNPQRSEGDSSVDGMSGDVVAETDMRGEEEEVDIRKADVSIINKQYLPSTLEYLNQRSRGEKFLLHQLRGSRAKNSIEQRLEALEMRPDLATVLPKKKVNVSSEGGKKQQKSGKRATQSFDDILGGMDEQVVGQLEKQRGKKLGKREEFGEGKKEVAGGKIGAKKDHQSGSEKPGDKAELKLKSNVSRVGGGGTGQSARSGSGSKSNKSDHRGKGRATAGEEMQVAKSSNSSSSGKKTPLSKSSCSDETRVETVCQSQDVFEGQGERKGNSQSVKFREEKSDTRQSSQTEEEAARQRRLRWEQARALKSARSQAFDQPIGGTVWDKDGENISKKGKKSKLEDEKTSNVGQMGNDGTKVNKLRLGQVKTLKPSPSQRLDQPVVDFENFDDDEDEDYIDQISKLYRLEDEMSDMSNVRGSKDDISELRLSRFEREKSQKPPGSHRFSQPHVGFGSDEDEDYTTSKMSRFRKQMEHIHDPKSTKAGYFPLQGTATPTMGLAFAGKGKGRGKNRNPGLTMVKGSGRNAGKGSGGGGGGFMPEISATENVSAEEIMEFVDMEEHDLGSDFSDVD